MTAVRQRTIWRFRVPFGDTPNVLNWPAGATPLSAALIGNDIDIWASVPDPDAPTVSKPFLLAGTGHLIPHHVEHVETLMQQHHAAPDGRFVWHLFHNPAQGMAAQTWDGTGRIVESRPSRG